MRAAALLFLLLPAALSPALGQDANAFFTLVNTYAYAEGPRRGERVLLRARQTLAVVAQAVDEEDLLWYRVVDPERRERTKGSGWVALDPHELNEKRDQPVLVFPVVVEQGDQPVQALKIPASDLTLANVTQPSASFAGITWQKVTYETAVPANLWVRSQTGIYRPFKSVQFVSEAYAEMVTRGVATDRLRRLLSGVVRVGDSPTEVEWALGLPNHTEESKAGELQITVWNYPGLRVRFENHVVKQIN